MSERFNTGSLIGKGSIFEGKFYVNGPLVVNGKFEGELITKGNLKVGTTGKLKSDVIAKEIIIEGTIIGNIKAQDFVKLTPTGKVIGNISAPNVELAQGVIAKGAINISGKNSRKQSTNYSKS